MTLSLLQTRAVHERRIRLVFSEGIVSWAGPWTVTNQDSAGVSPNVQAVIQASPSSNSLDLALDQDLVRGALYQVATTGVIIGVSNSVVGISDVTRFADDRVRTNTEPTTNDYQALVFGNDLVHSGLDFVEQSDGDLASISGTDNVTVAVRRRLLGDPLPWDDSYSPRAYDFVDGPQSEMRTLRGSLIAQARLDDRVRDISVDVTIGDEADTADAKFDVSILLIGDAQPKTFAIIVPPGTTPT